MKTLGVFLIWCLGLTTMAHQPPVPPTVPVPTSSAAASPRFEQTQRLIRWATSRGVEGFFAEEGAREGGGGGASASAAAGGGERGNAMLSPSNGVHGPRIVAARDIPQHECVLSVPFSCLVNASSWAADTALGRRLAAEGVLTNTALLGGGGELVSAAGEFQGSEPLLALWFLLQRRRWGGREGGDNSCTSEGEQSDRSYGDSGNDGSDAENPYFLSLDGPGEPGGVDGRCAFTWSEEALRSRLSLEHQSHEDGNDDGSQGGEALLSPTATRALAARGEVVAAYERLKELLGRSAVWQRFLAGGGGGGGSGDNGDGAAVGGIDDVSLEEYFWAYATVASRAIRFAQNRGDRESWSSLYMEPIGDLLNHAPPRHSPPPPQPLLQSSKLPSGGGPAVANIFRFLNEATGRIQYHAEDGGVAKGAELLYTYGALTPADSLLFYGFTADFFFDEANQKPEHEETEGGNQIRSDDSGHKEETAPARRLVPLPMEKKRAAAAVAWRRALEADLLGRPPPAQAMAEVAQMGEGAAGRNEGRRLLRAYDEAIRAVDADVDSALAARAEESEIGVESPCLLDCLEDCRRVLDAERTCLFFLDTPRGDS